MNTSGDAAEQIVRMSLEGVEVAARITGSAAKEIAVLLIAALKNSEKNLKHKGKARLTSMLKSGKPLEIFSLRDRDLAKFAQGAKQYGIVYSVLRNKKNSPDGLCDIMVKADDAPKISRVIERFKFATVDNAKIENEIVADKAAISGSAIPEKTVAELAMTDTEPEAPDVDETEKLLDELMMGSDEGRAVPDKAGPGSEEPAKTKPVRPGKEPKHSHPFGPNSPKTHLPSGHTSGGKKKPEKTILGKPSVKEELREIAVARKKDDTSKLTCKPVADKPKEAAPVTTHSKPQSNRKTKHRKTKGSR